MMLIAVCVALLVGVFPAHQARADDADRPANDPAMVLKKQADDDMDRNEYQDALDAYSKAYELWKTPALLYNEGRALQSLHRMPEAFDKLQEFKKAASPELLAKVPKLEELITEVAGHVSTLALTVDHPGASVKLDDRVIGMTPLADLRVNAGNAKLEVSLEGFGTESRNVLLPGNGRLEVSMKLLPRDTSATLLVKSSVTGAKVVVDGKAIGQVPSEVTVTPGSHTVHLSAPGHDDQEVTAVVKSGETKAVDVDLAVTSVTKNPLFWVGVIGGPLATGALIGGIYAGTKEKPPVKGSISPYIVTIQVWSPKIPF